MPQTNDIQKQVHNNEAARFINLSNWNNLEQQQKRLRCTKCISTN